MFNQIVENTVSALEQETRSLDAEEYEEVINLLIERLHQKLLDIE